MEIKKTEETLSTIMADNELGACGDAEELKERMLPILKEQKIMWADFFNDMLKKKEINKSLLSSRMGISRQSIIGWSKGAIPKSRETFLLIGMAFELNRLEMNIMLTKYGRYPELYSKTLEDCVCMYVLDNYSGEEIIQKYKYIYGKIKGNFISDDNEECDDIETREFDEKINEIKSDEELECFVQENTQQFEKSFRKLFAYIKVNINQCLKGQDNIKNFACTQSWTSSLRQCVSAINNHKWYPTRNKLISIGIHLNMNKEQLNDMLEKAHMAPLYPKNLFESIIIYILETAEVDDVFDEDNKRGYEIDYLITYAKEVLMQFDDKEIVEFIPELDIKENDVNE